MERLAGLIQSFLAHENLTCALASTQQQLKNTNSSRTWPPSLLNLWPAGANGPTSSKLSSSNTHLPSGKIVDAYYLPKDTKGRTLRRPRNKIEDQVPFATEVLPLRACNETSRLATEVFYNQNIFRIEILRSADLTPAAILHSTRTRQESGNQRVAIP
jgi:hypothetical protein